MIHLGYTLEQINQFYDVNGKPPNQGENSAIQQRNLPNLLERPQSKEGFEPRYTTVKLTPPPHQPDQAASIFQFAKFKRTEIMHRIRLYYVRTDTDNNIHFDFNNNKNNNIKTGNFTNNCTNILKIYFKKL